MEFPLNRLKESQILKRLDCFFDAPMLTQNAITTGFVKRKSKLCALSFLQLCLIHTHTAPIKSLSEACTFLREMIGVKLRKQSLDTRFNVSAVLFIRKLVEELIKLPNTGSTFDKTPSEKVNIVLKKVKKVVQSYVLGLGLVILIIAALNIMGLLILDIEYAVFFGVLGALLTIIPYVGIFIGSLLPILMSLLTKDSAWYAVGVAGVFFLVQVLEGNFITPNVVGAQISVNPLAAIVGLILGGMLWGAAGMILALPFIAVLKVLFDSVESLQPYGFLLGDSVEVTTQNKDLTQSVSDKIRTVITKQYSSKPNKSL